AVRGRLLLRLGLHLHRNRLPLGFLRRLDQLDALRTLGDFGLARGCHLFLGRDRQRTRLVRFAARLAFLAALVLDQDLLFLPRQFDRLFLRDARFLDRAVGLDLLGVDQLLGLDARALGLLVPLRLLARDLGRLD